MTYSFFRKASICVQVDKEIEEPQKQFNIGQVTKQKKKRELSERGRMWEKKEPKKVQS